MEIISKTYPINRPDDNKKTAYEINDNLLCFYYAFVYRNKSALHMLGAQTFYEEYIEPSLITFISFRFEEVCRTYFSLQAHAGRLKGVTNIGTYYYDDSTTRTSGEYDVVLQRKNAYDIYEVKYYSSVMPKSKMEAEADKIRKIKGLPLGKIGFIAIHGCEEYEHDHDCISGSALYE